jgi:hypothetical protein
MKEKNMPQHITRYQTERLDDAALQSKFANLQAILFRTQREQGERLQALAALETLEAEVNRPSSLIIDRCKVKLG